MQLLCVTDQKQKRLRSYAVEQCASQKKKIN